MTYLLCITALILSYTGHADHALIVALCAVAVSRRSGRGWLRTVWDDSVQRERETLFEGRRDDA
jgi:hypothetical protein